jgi:hypothetical protein
MGWERAFTGAGKLGPFGGGHKTSRILSLSPQLDFAPNRLSSYLLPAI